MNFPRNRTAALAAVVIVQLGFVAWAVDGQLSARLTGEEYLMRVGPVDPIDPFRGAYVELSYPDLNQGWEDSEYDEEQVFVPLEVEKGVLVPRAEPRENRPDDGLYITCVSDGWRLKCGIESLFLPEEEAAQVQKDINQSGLNREFDESGRPLPDRDSGYVARVKIDDRGNAAVIGLEKR